MKSTLQFLAIAMLLSLSIGQFTQASDRPSSNQQQRIAIDFLERTKTDPSYSLVDLYDNYLEMCNQQTMQKADDMLMKEQKSNPESRELSLDLINQIFEENEYCQLSIMLMSYQEVQPILKDRIQAALAKMHAKNAFQN